jgi:hypothetical protein
MGNDELKTEKPLEIQLLKFEEPPGTAEPEVEEEVAVMRPRDKLPFSG